MDSKEEMNVMKKAMISVSIADRFMIPGKNGNIEKALEHIEITTNYAHQLMNKYDFYYLKRCDYIQHVIRLKMYMDIAEQLLYRMACILTEPAVKHILDQKWIDKGFCFYRQACSRFEIAFNTIQESDTTYFPEASCWNNSHYQYFFIRYASFNLCTREWLKEEKYLMYASLLHFLKEDYDWMTRNKRRMPMVDITNDSEYMMLVKDFFTLEDFDPVLESKLLSHFFYRVSTTFEKISLEMATLVERLESNTNETPKKHKFHESRFVIHAALCRVNNVFVTKDEQDESIIKTYIKKIIGCQQDYAESLNTTWSVFPQTMDLNMELLDSLSKNKYKELALYFINEINKENEIMYISHKTKYMSLKNCQSCSTIGKQYGKWRNATSLYTRLTNMYREVLFIAHISSQVEKIVQFKRKPSEVIVSDILNRSLQTAVHSMELSCEIFTSTKIWFQDQVFSSVSKEKSMCLFLKFQVAQAYNRIQNFRKAKTYLDEICLQFYLNYDNSEEWKTQYRILNCLILREKAICMKDELYRKKDTEVTDCLDYLQEARAFLKIQRETNEITSDDMIYMHVYPYLISRIPMSTYLEMDFHSMDDKDEFLNQLFEDLDKELEETSDNIQLLFRSSNEIVDDDEKNNKQSMKNKKKKKKAVKVSASTIPIENVAEETPLSQKTTTTIETTTTTTTIQSEVIENPEEEWLKPNFETVQSKRQCKKEKRFNRTKKQEEMYLWNMQKLKMNKMIKLQDNREKHHQEEREEQEEHEEHEETVSCLTSETMESSGDTFESIHSASNSVATTISTFTEESSSLSVVSDKLQEQTQLEPAEPQQQDENQGRINMVNKLLQEYVQQNYHLTTQCDMMVTYLSLKLTERGVHALFYPYGSLATGLVTKHSDVDLVVTLTKYTEKHIFQEIMEILNQSGAFEIQGWKRQKNGLQVLTFYDRSSNIHFDITYQDNVEVNCGIETSKWIRQYLYEKTGNQTIISATKLVKEILYHAGLNKPWTGGLSGFATFMIVCAAWEHYTVINENISFLMYVLKTYSKEGFFDYQKMGIRVKKDETHGIDRIVYFSLSEKEEETYHNSGSSGSSRSSSSETRSTIWIENPCIPNVNISNSTFRFENIQSLFTTVLKNNLDILNHL
jgi:hypothetical protein